MRENLPLSSSKPGESGTVVASWWDYVYWITVLANKTTLADNATSNSTRIAQISRAFHVERNRGHHILRRYNVTRIVVYITFFNVPEERINVGGNVRPNDAYEYGGDTGKWIWMALISGGCIRRGCSALLLRELHTRWNYRDQNGNGRIESNEIFENYLF